MLAKAAEKGVIIEFNANPYRLDLDWTWIRRAKEMGVLIAVNPDAHSPHELNLARSHLPVARKGWLEREDVFNTRTIRKLMSIFRTKAAFLAFCRVVRANFLPGLSGALLALFCKRKLMNFLTLPHSFFLPDTTGNKEDR